MKLFAVLSIALIMSHSSYGSGFKQVNTDNKICNPCEIRPSLKKNSYKIQIYFILQKKMEKLQRVAAVKFEYPRKKFSRNTLKDKDLGWVSSEEAFLFHKLDLNEDGYWDLALEVFSGNEKKLEYWIFNPKRKRYIHQKRPLFELSVKNISKNKKLFFNQHSDGFNEDFMKKYEINHYRLSSNYLLRKIKDSR